MSRFIYKNKSFYLDEKPFQILSGALHYFRMVPEYWEDRLKKLKACGLNTVETYVAWNLHEPKEGQFLFDKGLDLSCYLKIAKELDLFVILRPGPYICAEWEFGGLPSWLLRYKGMRLRCNDKLFLQKTRNYFETLFAVVRPHLLENGGSVIAMQIENEYGSYGDDKVYLQKLADMYQELGMNCLLFTSDGPGLYMLKAGSLQGYLSSINFGSNPKDNFTILQRFNPEEPLFCCEYWNGWFDHWGDEAHHAREAEDVARVYREMLDLGASVNFYMFHGGTNFGFYNGANCGENYQPTVTSYDYNSLLSESGDMTEKYEKIKKVNEEYFGKINGPEVKNLPKKRYGFVALTKQAPFFENLCHISKPQYASYPLTMEELGQDYGFLVYETEVEGPLEEMDLTIDGIHDRALIYINGDLKGIQDRMGFQKDQIKIKLNKNQKVKITILVENLGRVNYGNHLWDEKGILKGVKIGPQYHYGYTMYPVDCRELESLVWKEADNETEKEFPTFLQGTFTIEETEDTFVRLDGFIKGNVWINGFNLGRYWNEAGPQKTLYLPAPLLKKGQNTLMVLELQGFKKREVLLTEKEDLG